MKRSVSNEWTSHGRYKMLNANELYEERTLPTCAVIVKLQFLAQVTNPQAFVNASYERYEKLVGAAKRDGLVCKEALVTHPQWIEA
jgi:hypothetical protein